MGHLLHRIVRSLALLAVLLAASPCSTARSAGSVAVLHWTATGDDGSVGTATRYDIRRSMIPLTATNFLLADTVGGAPVPLISGTQQACPVVLPTPGVTWYVAMRVVDEAGNWSLLSNVAGFVAPRTASRLVVPGEAAFAPPWPNPARVPMSIHLDVPERSMSELDLFDASGRRVRRLWSGELESGPQVFEWNLLDDRGQRVQPGVYFGRARIGTWSRTRRLVVAG
jgi:hypothetical protein